MKKILDSMIKECSILARILLADRSAMVTTVALVFAVALLISIYASAYILRDTSWLALKIVGWIGLSSDRSFGEIVNYGLAFLAAVLFFLASLDNRSLALFFLSLLLAFVWLDDSLSYHEQFGQYLADTMVLPGLIGLRPQESGELIAWSLAGVFLGPVLILSVLRRRSGDIGALALVGAGFAMLLIFGIFADFAHVAVDPRHAFLSSVIEDGGEMVAVAVVAGIAIGISRNGKQYYQIMEKKDDRIL